MYKVKKRDRVKIPSTFITDLAKAFICAFFTFLIHFNMWLTGKSWTSSYHRINLIEWFDETAQQPFSYKADITSDPSAPVYLSTSLYMLWMLCIVVGIKGSFMELLDLLWCCKRAVCLERDHMTAINPWIESTLDLIKQIYERGIGNDLRFVCSIVETTARSVIF